MTDLEINIAIAEACGYQIEPSQAKGGWRLYNEQSETSFWWNCDRPPTLSDVSYRLPNYCHDLNAMHEAEASQLWPDAAFWNRYSLELGGLCNSLAPALHATARERAEAFLRTIGKWKP